MVRDRVVSLDDEGEDDLDSSTRNRDSSTDVTGADRSLEIRREGSYNSP